ncbi:MAG: nitroreductase [Lachnospiraceae bacterium]|nr:nitroreductase [Lachnospiraceae bacterium]
MTEKEAILQRHSVRNYTKKAIEPDKVSQIIEKIDELNAAGGLHLQFIEDAGKTYNKLMNRAMGLGSAPSVIACVGKDAEDLDRRVGYYGEKLVLFLQQLGLNTCWAGTFNRKTINASVAEDERLVISIAVGYGETQGKQRKSKTADQIIEGRSDIPDWFKEGVDMALLAPTAINQQKFAIKLNDDDSVEFIDKGGVLSQVDIGIVRCHFEIGAGRQV